MQQKLLTSRIVRRYGVVPYEGFFLRSLVLSQSRIVEIGPDDVRAVTGDPEDDAVLATCRLGGSEYLVTVDKRLLDLHLYENTRIVTPRAFLELL